MSRRYRVNRFRILKKYIDMELLSLGVNAGETKREAILRHFESWHCRRYLNRYVNKYIKDPEKKSEFGGEKLWKKL